MRLEGYSTQPHSAALLNQWQSVGSQRSQPDHTFFPSSSLTPAPYYNQAGAQTKCDLWDFMEQPHGQPTHVRGSQTCMSLHHYLEPNSQGEGNYRNLFHFSPTGVASCSWNAANLALCLGLTWQNNDE